MSGPRSARTGSRDPATVSSQCYLKHAYSRPDRVIYDRAAGPVPLMAPAIAAIPALRFVIFVFFVNFVVKVHSSR
jgi:hypothetical protein